MKTVIHTKETEERKEKACGQAEDFLAFLGKLFVQKLPAPQQMSMTLTAGVSS